MMKHNGPASVKPCSASRLSRLVAEFRRDTGGAIAIMIALLLPMVIGMMGLTVDVGIWYAEKRGLQDAADAASLAGGGEIANGSGTAAIVAAALADANRNSFDGATDTITVNVPPVDGPSAGVLDSVEVIITRQMPLFFTTAFFKLIGASDQQFKATARAVVNLVPAGDFCILGLDPDESKAVEVFGNGTATLDCGVAVNSDADNALSVTGNATLTTTAVTTVGQINISGTLNSDSPPKRGPVIDDPYSDLEVPTFVECPPGSVGGTMINGGTTTLDAGEFDGIMVLCVGLAITAGATVFLEPGVYILDQGDFEISGNSSIEGVDVTIILTSSGLASKTGQVKITGGGAVKLSAPTEDPAGADGFSGVLFYQDRLAPSSGGLGNLFAGGAELDLEGALYFPSQELSFRGGAEAGDGCTQLIAKKVSIGGDTGLQTNCNDSGTRKVTGLKASLGE